MDIIPRLQERISITGYPDNVVIRDAIKEIKLLRNKNQRMVEIIDEYNQRLRPLTPIILALLKNDQESTNG